MATVNQTIEVEVPVSVVYNQWTRFESFPEFMKGVEAVEQLTRPPCTFPPNVGGVKRDYNAQILDQVPDSLVSWARGFPPIWTSSRNRGARPTDEPGSEPRPNTETRHGTETRPRSTEY